jgi:hypothetical protein
MEIVDDSKKWVFIRVSRKEYDTIEEILKKHKK